MHNKTCPQWLPQPLHGRWIARGYPEVVSIRIDGHEVAFRKTAWAHSKPGVIAQYREMREHDSLHLSVLSNGSFVIDHIDCFNPDYGLANAAKHADHDAGWGGFAGLLLGIGVTVALGTGAGLLLGAALGGSKSR